MALAFCLCVPPCMSQLGCGRARTRALARPSFRSQFVCHAPLLASASGGMRLTCVLPTYALAASASHWDPRAPGVRFTYALSLSGSSPLRTQRPVATMCRCWHNRRCCKCSCCRCCRRRCLCCHNCRCCCCSPVAPGRLRARFPQTGPEHKSAAWQIHRQGCL